MAVGACLAVVTAGGSNTTAIQALAEVEYAATQLRDTVYLVEPRPGLAGNLAVSVGDDGILLVDSDMMPLIQCDYYIISLKPHAGTAGRMLHYSPSYLSMPNTCSAVAKKKRIIGGRTRTWPSCDYIFKIITKIF